VLVDDPKVEAVVIASPQETHREIAEAAFARGKHVFCEKPLGMGLQDSRDMVAAAEKSGCINMIGFNYIRTPASQLARLIAARARSASHVFPRRAYRGFPRRPEPSRIVAHGRARQRQHGRSSPHIINCALALMGPIRSLADRRDRDRASTRPSA
jgi:predicted dehydrogenase